MNRLLKISGAIFYVGLRLKATIGKFPKKAKRNLLKELTRAPVDYV